MHDAVCHSVYSQNMKEAFDNLEQMAAYGQTIEWNDKRTELEMTYRFMLQYLTDGVNDPQREQVYNHLRISLLEVADRVKEQLLTKHSSNYVYCQMRACKGMGGPSEQEIMDELTSFRANLSLAGLIEDSMKSKGKVEGYSSEHEKSVSLLYNRLWLTDKFLPQEEDFVSHIIENEEIHFADKCLTVSAVTTSLIRMFDERKFNILVRAARNWDPQVAQRALVGVVLCAFLHNERTMLYRQLDEKLTAIAEDRSLAKSITTIILQFIRSKETEKVSKRIMEDFLPEIAKIGPLIQDKIRMSDLERDISPQLDKNPEWHNLLENGLTDKIHQFAEMQQEGVDVFLSTFSSMKSFPFFRETCNWFMPFHNHSSIAKIQGEEKLPAFWQVIMKSPLMCNSDKFSLALGLLEMPEMHREITCKSVDFSDEQLEILKENEAMTPPEQEKEEISNQYIQDLYRFFKLHPRHKDFTDPFKDLELYRIDFVRKMENAEDVMKSIGEAYFAKDYFEDSLNTFALLSEKGKENAELLQKTGYCHQRLGDFKQAIDCYKRADVIKPDSLWTLRKLAYCHRSIKETQKALDYYSKVERQAPDDLSIQLAIGNCHLELKHFDEALQVFFKIEFLAPGNKNVWRPIAWCSFVEGKLDQAEKYYKKLEEAERNQHDWLNLGHVSLCKGNRKDAIAHYVRSLKLSDSSAGSFRSLFTGDIPFLERNGFDTREAPLLVDKVLYEAGNS